MPVTQHPDLLVGISKGDDAAVYRLREDLALVQTVDFFPPIVDDPWEFGAIAAANALSDVYAMGGTPLLALNLVCFPIELPQTILHQILQGGAAKAAEAEVLIVGGHTIDDAEPKYGLAVTGTVHPEKFVTNAGARPGDQLILTKPVGTGIITTAAKNGQVDPATLRRAIDLMQRLNRDAAAAMVHVGANACTDVTGFGLAGHLGAMMKASGTSARLSLSAVPVIEGTWELVEAGIAPGGTHRNYDSVGRLTRWHRDIPEHARLLLCDAQTSGGLLISAPEGKASALLEELCRRSVDGVVVGEVMTRTDATIEVQP